MRLATSVLSAALLLCPLGRASGRQQKQTEPQWTEVTITGFLLKGGVANVLEGDVTAALGGVVSFAEGGAEALGG